MPWLKMDDNFITNPKLLSIGSDAKVLYFWALGFAGQQLTDGFIATKVVRQIAGLAGVEDASAELVEARLWEPVEGGYQIHDYLDYNPSRKDVEEKRDAVAEGRSKAGKAGAERRWQTDSKPIANAWQNDGPVPHPVPVPDPVNNNEPSLPPDKYADLSLPPQPPKDNDPTVERLMAHGITYLTANKLAAGRDAFCETWMDYADKQTGLPNVAAYLTGNIKAGKPPPTNGHGPPGDPEHLDPKTVAATLEAMDAVYKARPAATRSLGP